MTTSAKGGALRAALLVNAATLLWAGNVVLGRALREAVGPWTLAGLRAGIASILFGALLLRGSARSGAAGRREWLLVALMAASGVVGFQVLVYAGLRYTTALNAGLVNATGPLITLLLSRILLGQPLRRTQFAGALLSLVGVAQILSHGSWATLWTLRLNPGDLLILAAVHLWALYSIASRAALSRRSTVWVTATSTVMGAFLLVVPAAFECYALPPRLQPGIAAAVLYIGIGPSFLAFLAWNEGIRRLGPSGAMAFYNTLPLYAGLLAGGALGEWPGGSELVGGVLVVGGCLLASRPPRAPRDRADGTPAAGRTAP